MGQAMAVPALWGACGGFTEELLAGETGLRLPARLAVPVRLFFPGRGWLRLQVNLIWGFA